MQDGLNWSLTIRRRQFFSNHIFLNERDADYVVILND